MSSNNSIRDRVATLIKRRDANKELSQLPKPILNTAEEVTFHIRKIALEQRNAMVPDTDSNKKKLKTTLPSVERCKTFHLPQAETELFLHAEKWHFHEDNNDDYILPCFEPASVPVGKTIGEYFDLEYFSPAWNCIGEADDGYKFLMCVDPESSEFGDLKVFHSGGGPAAIEIVCSENENENGEKFLNLLETDASFFFWRIKDPWIWRIVLL